MYRLTTIVVLMSLLAFEAHGQRTQLETYKIAKQRSVSAVTSSTSRVMQSLGPRAIRRMVETPLPLAEKIRFLNFVERAAKQKDWSIDMGFGDTGYLLTRKTLRATTSVVLDLRGSEKVDTSLSISRTITDKNGVERNFYSASSVLAAGTLRVRSSGRIIDKYGELVEVTSSNKLVDSSGKTIRSLSDGEAMALRY